MIRTRSLLLRRFSVADTRDVFRLSREESLGTWIPDQVYADESDAAEVLRFLIAQYDLAAPRTSPYVLAACLSASGELVGHVGFSPLGADVEVGFAIAMAHQRKGFATECVAASVPWAIECFRLPSVVGVAAVANLASCRVLERSGFQLESEKERLLHGRVQWVRQYRHSPRSASAEPIEA